MSDPSPSLDLLKQRIDGLRRQVNDEWHTGFNAGLQAARNEVSYLEQAIDALTVVSPQEDEPSPDQQFRAEYGFDHGATRSCPAIPLASQPTTEPLPNWRPIETAPKDGRSLLVLFDEWEVVIAGFIEVDDPRHEGWFDGHGGCVSPTHWMPLPTPPEAQ